MRAQVILLLIVSSACWNLSILNEELGQIEKNWVSGHNKYFDGMSIESIEALMGTIQTPLEQRLPTKHIPIPEDLPEQFDSMQAWPSCETISEVRDQSTCGSCWAFAAVEAMSDRICISNGQRVQTRISAENLLSCCGLECGKGCNGGSPHGAWSYYKKKGIVTGGLYNDSNWCQPYTFPPCDHHTEGKYQPCEGIKPTPKCSKSCQSSYPSPSYANDHHFAQEVFSVPSHEKSIQTEIMTNGPVQASFTVYTDFLTYRSGVYHHVSGSKLGGHSVKIIGWGIEDDVKYWLVVNSWNEDWGDNGFFKIKRGTDECGIEKEVVAGIPRVDHLRVE